MRQTASLPVNDRHLTADISQLTLERERVKERERRLAEEEYKIEQERLRLAEERRMFYEDQERRSVVSERPAHYRPPNQPFREYVIIHNAYRARALCYSGFWY